MQLAAPARPASVRGRLSAAACVLLASGMPSLAAAQSAGTTELDATGLIYGEANRTSVVEPTARVTRLFPDGQSLSAQLGIDVISGASPSGALPTGKTQTTTSASGSVTTTSGSEIPTAKFKDLRGALDAEWQKPFWGWITPTVGGHYSREKDYQSVGANGKLSIDVMRHLTTLTAGAGINHDGVFPVGGTPAGLSDGTVIVTTGSNPKRVLTALAGLSRVVTRRWILGVTASRTFEDGYLTEPYKVLSVVDPSTGLPGSQLTDKRPSTRDRTSVLGTSVYHLSRDVLYLSYRYYTDDWQVRSHTADLKYRRELDNGAYLEPHVRYYTQTAASFFRYGLVSGDPLPEYATSDYRLNALQSATIGATYGFRVPDTPGEWSVRAEYIGQFGDGHPASAVGAQRQYDLFPTVNIGSLVASYSVSF